MGPVLQVLPTLPQQVGLLLAIGLSVWVLSQFTDLDVGPLRRRLVLGVPWGTLLVAVGLLFVFAVVQGAGLDFRGPTTLPFRAWSFFYPTGMLLSGFSHQSVGHLTGNVTGLLVFGSLAEYAWGHYPRKRGVATFSSLGTNPYARIGGFVIATLVVGALTGLFALGPAIGFSGVVFAYAAFALVQYPIATLVALLGGRVLSITNAALRDPTFVDKGREVFVTPWWATIAIQGHLLGVLVGAVLGLYFVRTRRTDRHHPLRLWVGVLVYAVAQNLWAVYLPRSGGFYVLFRAVGTAFVFLLAALVVSAALATDRPLVPSIDLQAREVAVGLTIALLVAVALVATPYNLFTVADADIGVTEENSVQVRDYTVFYAEDVPDQYVSSVQVGPLETATQVNASGVIVVSEARGIWWETVSTEELLAANDGRVGVRIGGIGWSEVVVANRTAWRVAGNQSVYTVAIEHGDTRRLAFTSPPSEASPVVQNRNVSLVAGEQFLVRVTRENETLDETPIPAPNTNTTAGGLQFVRTGDSLFVTTLDNSTRVQIAQKQERTADP